MPLKLSSRTVLVTYWVSLLFSEAPLEDVLICSLSSFFISLLLPFLKPISSIAAGEYHVGLDEDMDPEGTGSGL